MNELEKDVNQMFPQGISVKLKTKDYMIKPFGFGQFPKVIKLFEGVGDIKASKPEGLSVSDFMRFAVENSEIVIEFSMLATKEKRDFFDDLPPDEGIKLLQAIIEVNLDFFMSRLQPVVMEALEKLTKSAGAVSSQLSSPTATA